MAIINKNKQQTAKKDIVGFLSCFLVTTNSKPHYLQDGRLELCQLYQNFKYTSSQLRELTKDYNTITRKQQICHGNKRLVYLSRAIFFRQE